MNIPVQRYRTWLFDCDGVILNSNKIKTEAFFNVALPYGRAYAEELVQYHLDNGGISRYVKAKYFFENILGIKSNAEQEKRFLDDYSKYVFEGLMSCEIDEGIFQLFQDQRSKSVKFYVVSGGDQWELRRIFRERKLDKLFNGIFGSPAKKIEIIKDNNLIDKNELPAVFVGDSRLDYEVSAKLGIDFIFVTHWTEFRVWKEYFNDKQVWIIENLKKLRIGGSNE